MYVYNMYVCVCVFICEVSSFLPNLCRFQESSYSRQACTARAFTHWANLLALQEDSKGKYADYSSSRFFNVLNFHLPSYTQSLYCALTELRWLDHFQGRPSKHCCWAFPVWQRNKAFQLFEKNKWQTTAVSDATSGGGLVTGLWVSH